jgi:hypothetical protein
MQKRYVVSLGWLVLWAGSYFTLSAQNTGTIVGQVSDPTGAAVPNATVEVENVGTGLVRTGVTETLGTYLIPALPLGAYKLSVRATGFKAFSQSGISLQLGQNARVDATLELGSMTETVEVVAEALRVDSRSTTLGASITNRQISDLPLDGRNPLRLLQYLPGVGNANIQTAPIFARGSGPSFNVSGARGTGNSIMLDGTVLAAAMTNFGVNLPNPDALTEFRMLTNAFSAEYGRAEGSIILAATKSGTNELHGSLWEFLRNDALNARNFFASGDKPLLRQNQFGLAVGGPVVLPKYHGRDRTFFFATYEGLRLRQEAFNIGFPTTAAERAGDFSASSAPIIDPLTGNPFPANQVPPDRLDPLAQGMLQFIPLPNQPDGLLRELRSLPISGNQYVAKVDHMFSDSDRTYFRYYRNKYVSHNSGGGISNKLVGPTPDTTQSFSLGYNHIFSPNLFNEFQASYTRWSVIAKGSPAGKDPKDLGGLFNATGTVPQTPYIQMAARQMNLIPSIPILEIDNFYQLDEKVSWLRGRHHIRAGVRAMLARHMNDAQVFTSGAFFFNPTFTQNAMADYMIGRPSFLLMYSIILDDAKRFEYHPFVQDDIKLARNLTLNLGLRYELDPPWFQRNGRNSQFRFGDVQSTVFPSAPPGLVFVGEPGIPKGLYPTDKNNFAPRIGLAWDPFGNGRTAVRAGYGIFYQPTPQHLSAFGTNNAPFILPLATVPHSFSDPYFGREDPFPYDFSKNPRFEYPIEVLSPGPNLRNGYVQQFNLTVQRQFGDDLAATVAYVGNVSHKLLQVRDLNTAVFGPGATAANVQQRRPVHPEFFSGLGFAFSDANANYHSLQVEVQKRWSKGYTFQAAYTYSKAIDDSSTDGALDGLKTLQNPNDYRKGNRGLTDFDQRHILAVNGIWKLPFLQNKGALTSVLGGWELNAMARVTTGLPINVTSGCDCALIGSGRDVGPQRPNVVGNPILDAGRPRNQFVAQYFNPAAFAVPAPGEFGNTGRNSLIGPGFSKTDLGIAKRFPLWEGSTLQLRGEIFDLFNQVNFFNPNNILLSPAFGEIQAAHEARIVQFGLKWEF